MTGKELLEILESYGKEDLEIMVWHEDGRLEGLKSVKVTPPDGKGERRVVLE
jgi:hypothetical protein